MFREHANQIIKINGVEYRCLKVSEDSEIQYIFFSEKLRKEQLEKRGKKFKRELEKNDSKLWKMKRGKELATYISREGYILAKGSL